jgi:inositol hexakisphosphate/diphosphoinositol-pentakisphosphate kinase
MTTPTPTPTPTGQSGSGLDIYSQPTDEYHHDRNGDDDGEPKEEIATPVNSFEAPPTPSKSGAKTTEEHPFKMDIGGDETSSNIADGIATNGETEGTRVAEGPGETIVGDDVAKDAAPTTPATTKALLANEDVEGCFVTIETVHVLPNPSSASATENLASGAHDAAAAEIEASKLREKAEKAQKSNQESLKTNAPLISSAIDFGAEQQNRELIQQQESDGRILIGICAMDKKARSKPMAEILSRLDESLFRVVFFGDDLILNRPIEEWPANIDVLIAFYSKGYPLQKAKDYVQLRRPFCLNDLDMQERLQDRRMVYDLLEASGIDVPRHIFFSQDGYKSTGSGDGNKQGETTVKEFDDHIEVNGVSIHKPFVEKPVDADDHNIAIYYPTSAGGGCKKLFRKIGNRSSEFYPDINEIRRDGSYVYEEFVETQGTDVKMYTVGPDYGHAEARKSPTVDGKVQRNADGKELRFPVILTLSEKEIARRIVLQFKQFVCGFDLLRVQEGHSVVSYCCDVNGFSFVKNSRKYYDDCAQILTEHMLAVMKPEELTSFSTLDPLVTEVDNNINFMNPLQRVSRLLSNIGNSGSSNPDVGTTNSTSDTLSEDNEETRSTGHLSTGVLSTEDPTLLEEGAVPVRQIPRDLISQPASLPVSRNVSSENLLSHEKFSEQRERRNGSNLGSGVGNASSCTLPSNRSSLNMHQEELRCVIAVVRHADRTPKEKLKLNTSEPIILKYFRDHSDEPNSAKDLKIKKKSPMQDFLAAVRDIIAEYEQKENLDKKGEKIKYKFMHMRDVLERWKFSGLNRKLQIKPKKISTDETTGETTVDQVQLILKWGGDLTKLGENQAIQLGQQFRHSIYPDSP